MTWNIYVTIIANCVQACFDVVEYNADLFNMPCRPRYGIVVNIE